MAPQPSRDPGSDHELTATYEENYDLLVGIAIDRFGIPRADAETLVQEIFLQLLLHASRIRDRRAWLIGAVYNASKDYLRRAQRVQPLPENASNAADPRYVRVDETRTRQRRWATVRTESGAIRMRATVATEGRAIVA